MYYSYVMGIDDSITELKNEGFLIKTERNNYMVSFPEEKALVWEMFITNHLKLGYWNEYFADDCIIFLFHLQDGMKRYEVYNFENAEVLALCEKLVDRKFESIKAMLMGNHFYQEKIK